MCSLKDYISHPPFFLDHNWIIRRSVFSMYYEKANVYITNDKKILFDLNKYDIYEIDDES